MNIKYTFYFLTLLSIPILGAQKSHWYLRKGEQQYEDKNWSVAKSAYLQSGASFIAQYDAGNAAYQQDVNEEALALYEKSLQIAKTVLEKADANYNLGNAYLRLGKYQNAITAYENSLRLASNRPDAQKNLQIAKKKLKPPPPQPPKPPPPPPTVASQLRYLDQGPTTPHREKPSGNLPMDEAKRLLEAIVVPDEQRNVRAYRELSPAVRATRAKDW
jgi:tetratricopeptide (TPR) repeat protein